MKSFSTQHLIWLVLLLGLLLRLPFLNGSFWLDEAAQALESARPFTQQLDIAKDFQPPLLHLLLHFALYLNTNEWWLRTVGALIPGLITIWATYRIGEKLLNRQAGLLTSLLLATSSFHIFFSQELRPYSLPTMWAVLSWLLLIFLTKNKLATRRKIQLFGLYTLCSIAGLYSSYLYPFLLLAQVVHIAIDHRSYFQKFLSSWLITSLSFLPWLPYFYGQLRVGGEFRQQLPGWEEVVSFTQLKSLLLVGGKFLFGVVNLELTALFIFMACVLGIAISASVWRLMLVNNKSFTFLKHDNTFRLLLSWFLVPLVSAWFVSFWIPVVQPKRVLFLLPAFYLAFTWLVHHAKQQWYVSLASLLLVINLYGTTMYYLRPQLQRENWRDLYHTVAIRYPVDDTLVVFSFDEPFAPWRWYNRNGYASLVTGKLYIHDVKDLQERLAQVTEYQYILVFDYLRDLTDPDDVLLREIEAYGFTEIDTLDQPNIGFVRVYSKPEYLLSQQSLTPAEAGQAINH